MLKNLSLLVVFLSFTAYAQTIPIDPTFNEGETGANGDIHDFVALPDGKIIIVGYFTEYNGVDRRCIARINADGSLDESFDPGVGASRSDGSLPFILSVELCPDGKILIGGNFEKYNEQDKKILVRLKPDGSLDPFFDTGDLFDYYESYDNGIHDIELADDNKIFACGSVGLVKLNDDGSHDASFSPEVSGAFGYTTQVKVLEDGKLIIGGWYLLESGLGRLNPDGSVDDSFYYHENITGVINSIFIEEDGKILAGGLFNDDDSYFFLLRTNEDGALDESFTIQDAETIEEQPNSGVYCIRKHLGKTLVSGLFDSLGNSGIDDIALINSDGTVDASFDTGEWPSRYIRSVFVQNNTNVLVAPHYQSWTEPHDVPGLLRLGDGCNGHKFFSA